jgi:hypothetical protein
MSLEAVYLIVTTRMRNNLAAYSLISLKRS